MMETKDECLKGALMKVEVDLTSKSGKREAEATKDKRIFVELRKGPPKLGA